MAAAVAVAVVVGVASTSGDGSAAPSAGKQPGLPTLPGGKYTDLPTRPGGAPSGGSTRTSTRTPTGKATQKNDWDTATGDTTVFTAEEWFPATGTTTLGTNSYNHLAKQTGSCASAEPKMGALMTSTCVKVIQSLWTNSSKTQVGALSVVSLRDKTSADSLQSKLSGDDSDGDYIKFLSPPGGSGVSITKMGPTWVSTTVTGHYLVIAEAGRADGQAVDADTRAMVNDMRETLMEYVHTIDG